MDTIGTQLAVPYTVEPLYSGHHWDPAGCPVQRGVPHLEVDFTQRYVAGTADSVLREGSIIQRVIYCVERFCCITYCVTYTFEGGGVYVLIYRMARNFQPYGTYLPCESRRLQRPLTGI